MKPPNPTDLLVVVYCTGWRATQPVYWRLALTQHESGTVFVTLMPTAVHQTHYTYFYIRCNQWNGYEFPLSCSMEDRSAKSPSLIFWRTVIAGLYGNISSSKQVVYTWVQQDDMCLTPMEVLLVNIVRAVIRKNSIFVFFFCYKSIFYPTIISWRRTSCTSKIQIWTNS